MRDRKFRFLLSLACAVMLLGTMMLISPAEAADSQEDTFTLASLEAERERSAMEAQLADMEADPAALEADLAALEAERMVVEAALAALDDRGGDDDPPDDGDTSGNTRTESLGDLTRFTEDSPLIRRISLSPHSAIIYKGNLPRTAWVGLAIDEAGFIEGCIYIEECGDLDEGGQYHATHVVQIDYDEDLSSEAVLNAGTYTVTIWNESPNNEAEVEFTLWTGETGEQSGGSTDDPPPDDNDHGVEVGERFQDCADCPEMIVVPAGSYRVTISEPFAVGVYEVTFTEWDACRQAGGCGHSPDDEGWGRGNRPVINVSWDHAQQYVGWLSEETGKKYRLLSESEWEYVARAGTTTRYHWGDDIGRNRANCYGCGSHWDGEKTAPVGSFSPNAFGLYDTHGNVWEWAQDCWNESYEGAPTDGRAWESGHCGYRVMRGGSWNSPTWFMRSANRLRNPTYTQYSAFGFRVARTLGQDPVVGQTLHTWQHEDAVLAVAFSPDGRLVLIGLADGIAALRDVTTGQIVHTWRHGYRVAAAFSPDGRQILIGSAGTVVLRDVATGERTWQHQNYGGVVRTVAFSPDGRLVLTGSEGAIATLRDAATGETVHTWRHERVVEAVAFSPDSRLAMTGSWDSTVVLRDVATGETMRTWQHEASVYAVAFSPDGRLALTGSLDSTAVLRDVATGETMHTWQHKGSPHAVAFSPDGELALTGASDGTAVLRDVATGETVHTWRHEASVYTVAFSPDGRLVLIGSADGTAVLRDISGSEPGISLDITAPDPLTGLLAEVEGYLQPVVHYAGEAPLAFALTTAPPGMEIDARSGTITWFPVEAEAGRTFDVTVKVGDGTLFDSVSFQVSVLTTYPVQTEVSDGVLTVTDTSTDLQGLSIAATDTTLSVSDLQLETVEDDAVISTVPDAIDLISDFFVVREAFPHPVELTFPVGELPAGTDIRDVDLYSFVEASASGGDGPFWLPVLVDWGYEMVNGEPAYIVSLEGLQGLFVFGLQEFPPEEPTATTSVVLDSATQAIARNVKCYPNPGLSFLEPNYRGQTCIYENDPDVEIVVKDFGRFEDSEQFGVKIETLVAWVIETQNKLDDLGFAHDKSIIIDLDLFDLDLNFFEAPLGSVYCGLGARAKAIRLYPDEINSYASERRKTVAGIARSTIAHEYFHHAQCHKGNSIVESGKDLELILPRFWGGKRNKWLTEGSADWFAFQLSQAEKPRITEILKAGLNAVPKNEPKKDARGDYYLNSEEGKAYKNSWPYFRSAFFTLLSKKCGDDFGSSMLKRMLNVETNDASGIQRLFDVLAQSRCVFADMGHGLEAALVYYQNAAVTLGGDELNDNEAFSGFDGPDERISWSKNLLDVNQPRTRGPYILPAVSAQTFRLGVQTDQGIYSEEQLVEVSVNSTHPVTVSVVPDLREDFRYDHEFSGRRMGGRDHLLFNTRRDGRTSYSFQAPYTKNEKRGVYMTLVNPDLEQAIEVSFTVQIVDDPTSVDDPTFVDLGIRNFYVDDSSGPLTVSPGDSLNLEVLVENVDPEDFLGRADVRYYRSDDSSISSADGPPIGTDETRDRGIVSGDFVREYHDVKAPSSGTHYYGACVEVDGDTNTSNNCSSPGVRVVVETTPDPPDMSAHSPSVDDATLTPGQSFRLWVGYSNQGGPATGSTTLTYYRSSNQTISTSDNDVDTATITNLAASDTGRMGVTLTAPDTAGTYYYGGCIKKLSDETNTSNNCSSPGVRVVVENPPAPDLVITKAWVLDDDLRLGEALDLHIRVKNRGSATSSKTQLRYYRSTKKDMTAPGRVQVDTWEVPSLSVDEEFDDAASLGSSLPGGSAYYYGACVDPVPNESDDTNNCSEGILVSRANAL